MTHAPQRTRTVIDRPAIERPSLVVLEPATLSTAELIAVHAQGFAVTLRCNACGDYLTLARRAGVADLVPQPHVACDAARRSR